MVDLQSTGLRYNFIFPYPLGGEYVLVNCEKAENPGTFGIYLADTFSNLTLIAEIEKQGLFWPIPIKEQPTPPVIQDRRAKNTDMATMFITNVYNGEGTKGVPPGTIKKLLLFAYHFCYLDSGGHESVGVQSSWDIKQVLGTVPVDEDGSANFTVPANTSFGILPLDENGAAVQIMRSWTVGMPGEKATCNGCHESQLDITPAVLTSASRRPSSAIEEYHGPRRTMAFETELYYNVVLKYCIGCHDGTKEGRPSFADPQTAYDNIHPFVHRPGPETDMDVFPPYEFHVSTSELWKMLVEKGHYNVKLDEEAKNRIATWIDLNAPWRGKWGRPEQAERRLELSRLYAGISEDYESDFDRLLEEERNKPKPEFVKPEPFVKPTDTLTAENWPFDEAAAKRLQKAALAGGAARKTIELENGAAINFVRIPAGTFVMGSLDGYPDENPRSVVTIDKPFWMSETEITNEQYAAFNPDHDTRYLDEHGKDHIVPGYIANHPQPALIRHPAAEPGHQDRAQRGDKLHRRVKHGAHLQRLQHGADVGEILFVHPLCLIGLPAKGLDFMDARQVVLQLAVQFAHLLLGNAEEGAHLFGEDHAGDENQRDRRAGDQRQPPVDGGQHHQHAHERDQVGDGFRNDVGVEQLKIPGVVDHPAHQVARLLVVEEAQVHPLQLVVGAGAQVAHQVPGRPVGQVVAHEAEQYPQQVQRRQCGGENEDPVQPGLVHAALHHAGHRGKQLRRGKVHPRQRQRGQYGRQV